MKIKELKAILEKFDESLEVRIAEVNAGNEDIAFDIEAMSEATENDVENGFTGKFALIYADLFYEHGVPYKA